MGFGFGFGFEFDFRKAILSSLLMSVHGMRIQFRGSYSLQKSLKAHLALYNLGRYICLQRTVSAFASFRLVALFLSSFGSFGNVSFSHLSG